MEPHREEERREGTERRRAAADPGPGARQRERSEARPGLAREAEHLARDLEAVATDLRHVARESGAVVRRSLDRNPYGTLAAAGAVGYVVAGGLASHLTRTLVRNASRAFTGRALAALFGELGAVESDEESP